MPICLMCGSSAYHIVGQLRVATIIDAYQTTFGVDVTRAFSPGLKIMQLNACSDCDLKYYSPLVVADDQFYEDLQKHYWYYQEYKPEYDFARMHVATGDNVLEVGCGKGAFRKFLPADIQYRGIEFNQAAVEKARSGGLNVDVVTVEKEAFLNPDFYNVVCHFQALEHVSAPRLFLQACVQALRPGGKLIVAVPSEDSFLSLAEGSWLNMPPHHLTRWSDKALKSAFNAVGLDTQEFWHEPVADFHSDWYGRVLINAGLKRIVGAGLGIEPDRFWSKVSHRFINIPLVREALVRVGEKGFAHSGRGHTVCAVAIKRHQ